MTKLWILLAAAGVVASSYFGFLLYQEREILSRRAVAYEAMRSADARRASDEVIEHAAAYFALTPREPSQRRALHALEMYERSLRDWIAREGADPKNPEIVSRLSDLRDARATVEGAK